MRQTKRQWAKWAWGGLLAVVLAALSIVTTSSQPNTLTAERPAGAKKLELPQLVSASRAMTALAVLQMARGDEDVALSLTVRPGRAAAFSCTGTSGQSIAACSQKCLALQTGDAWGPGEVPPPCGCSSINNGCECTCDPP